MRALSLWLTIVSLSSFASCYTGGHRDIYHDQYGYEFRRELHRRNIVYNGQIANSYDFVIIGGGTAGLALASRLSEDSNHTVLVLEAGDTGDAVSNAINVPGNAYYTSLLGSSYDWAFTTVQQPQANNRAIGWPRGKVLGGCSAVNGMYMVRPSKLEVDASASMIDGGDKWNWNSLFAGMKKSEIFTPPSDEIKQEGNIMYDPSSHGTTGPVHVSYPGFIVPVVGNWTQTLADIGIPFSADANGGDGWGAFIATSAINPTNWTRSYSRSAYIDPLPPRPNLDILANATVTRIIFSNSTAGNLTATAVEFASSRSDTRRTVSVAKEVILAGGAVGSPHILLHSGIGPKDVLDTAGVATILALPGVGQHLQDHISTEVVWNTSDETAASIHLAKAPKRQDGSSPAFLSFINSATAYANISDLVGLDDYQSFQANIASAVDVSASSLVPSTDPTVIAGYKAIYNITTNLMLTPIGQIELLLSLTGTAQGGAQSIAVQAALQHPLSQGRLYINSADPFDYPIIDPAYFTHSADKVLLREGLKLARKIGNTVPLSSAMLGEVSPGPSVQSDDDWDAWIANAFGTEFHPSCSCAMLPQNLGGVVDSELKVYGTANVRVADASVFPIQYAAHLQAPVFGLAEQAANIIRSQWNGVSLTPASSVTPPSATSSSQPSPTASQKSGASWNQPSFFVALVTAAFTILISGL